ncbi:hypothetical protein [Niveibacterium sp.]|uniref:hypothetical protein n=1 Tax=Niveibacterium sp. TaxID=2017444 RepID=UPI0035ADCF45
MRVVVRRHRGPVGAGVAVTRRSIASGERAAGRLVKVFSLEVPTELSYWYATTDGVRETPLMQRFGEWVTVEVVAS